MLKKVAAVATAAMLGLVLQLQFSFGDDLPDDEPAAYDENGQFIGEKGEPPAANHSDDGNSSESPDLESE